MSVELVLHIIASSILRDQSVAVVLNQLETVQAGILLEH